MERLMMPIARVCCVAIVFGALQAQAFAVSIDPATRAASQAFYNQEYLPSEGIPIGWTGDVGSCDAGTTSVDHRAAVLRRVNYFRAMAGIPAEIVFTQEFNDLAQEAALIMSANNALSHFPPESWTCWSEEGHTGASKSNLFLGVTGVPSMDGYIRDPGAGNAALGHRRWMLHPTSQEMGTGDVSGGGARASNALLVVEDHFWDPKPTLRDPFIAWPAPGFMPYDVVFPRWHVSFDDADNVDLSGTSVTMTLDGQVVPTSIEWQSAGFRDDYLVWRVDGMGDHASFPKPTEDVTYTVTLDGVVIDGTTQQVVYDVTLFDPLATPSPPGDYDGNGSVGPEDYALWKSTFGDTIAAGTGADGNGNALIDAADYTIWRDHLSSGGSAALVQAVPEPTTAMLLVGLLGISWASGARKGRGKLAEP